VFAVRHFILFFTLFSLACSTDPPPPPTPATAGITSASLGPPIPPLPSAKESRPPIDGAPLYARYCALCHGKDGKGYAADNAPSLVSQTFLDSASNHFIAQGIRLGRPGTAMAAYAKRYGGPLEEGEVQAIVKFLRASGSPKPKMLPPVGQGDAETGAQVYQRACATCHGTEAQRGKAPILFNPEFLSAATPTFMRYAIVNGRPPTEMPAFGAMLSEKEIDDVVVFLASKRPGYREPRPEVDPKDLANLPVVINPKGATPTFTLREGRFVSIEQVKKAFDAKSRMVIIDARAASDFVRGHIPGSIVNSYFDKIGLDRVPKDGTWVIAYCACPHHASGEVVDELRRRGYENTAVLDEGILEWEKRGYPMAEWPAKDEKKPANNAEPKK
jgi:cytochrome c oxidase cbb3-type subunit III